MYDYFREYPDPDDSASDLANNHSLGGFLARLVDCYPYLVNDMRVRLLVNLRRTDSPPCEEDLERATAMMLAWWTASTRALSSGNIFFALCFQV